MHRDASPHVSTGLPVRQVLLALHVSFSVALLGGASALSLNVARSEWADMGFARDETLFVGVRPRYSVDDDDARRRSDYARVLAAIQAQPYVQAAAYGGPMVGESAEPAPSRLTAETRTRERPVAVMRGEPALLQTLGTRLVEGRYLDAGDLARAVTPVDLMEAKVQSISSGEAYEPPHRTPAVVVDATLAATLWPGQAAVGRTFSLDGNGVVNEVAGVIEPLRHTAAGPDAPTVFELQRVGEDDGSGGLQLAVRVSGNADRAKGRIEALVRELLPDPVMLRVRSANDLIAEQHIQERLGARIFSWFGVTSAILGLAGTYGLVTYLVLLQRRELGIRLALGGSLPGLRRRMALRVLFPVTAGAAGGLLLSAWLGAAMVSRLVGMQAPSLQVQGAAAALFTVAAWLASAIASRTAGAARIVDLLRQDGLA
jgi:putative ABC transport system permease protein